MRFHRLLPLRQGLHLCRLPRKFPSWTLIAPSATKMMLLTLLPQNK
ncbi:uncharacterized protein CLUP02_12063 [Colletotrichum lupini]|uniref:Uncharacterized protein n=1 Tax=Colletotrichum lupini TaxID=145971 RepID=A0A9Q8T1G3_9PEZI|nr:uncharacterized protein CLUP02_12063 [Colletotrichum lupini]UQC86561.1 hypothetical protein CLUP02_12063 [Colletotrichum lupini]